MLEQKFARMMSFFKIFHPYMGAHEEEFVPLQLTGFILVVTSAKTRKHLG